MGDHPPRPELGCNVNVDWGSGRRRNGTFAALALARSVRGLSYASLTFRSMNSGTDFPSATPIVHYHRERNHQAWATDRSRTSNTRYDRANNNAPIERRERLGRLLNFYDRRAA